MSGSPLGTFKSCMLLQKSVVGYYVLPSSSQAKVDINCRYYRYTEPFHIRQASLFCFLPHKQQEFADVVDMIHIVHKSSTSRVDISPPVLQNVHLDHCIKRRDSQDTIATLDTIIFC
jgi:hypothetical protein